MRYGDADYGDLIKLRDEMSSFAEQIDNVLQEIANFIAQALLANAVEKTPVITGVLRGSWRVEVVKEGEDFVVIITNIQQYASYVEYGHRTPGGGWAEGKHMLKLSVDEVKAVAPGRLDEMLTERLKRLM